MTPYSYHACPLRVLAVDDDLGILEVLRAMLAEDGHHVEVAGGGQVALGLLPSQRWHVVLTDFEMPGMNGEELARRIKAISPRLPIVMVSSLPPPFPCADVDALVAKPFTRASLIFAISRCLAAASPEADPSMGGCPAAA